jgi:regulator of cell morphogenesis and NO signaling
MSIDIQRTVAEITLERPQAAAVFEKLGIDYCCGGGKPLAAACEVAGVNVAQVTDLLEQAAVADKPGTDDGNWTEQSLASLVRHIVEMHHTYCREEGSRLQPLLDKVVSKHREHHPELTQVQDLFTSLRNELGMHMLKEEQVLFPFIVALEDSASRKSISSRAPFGTVQNPVRMMVQEHDNAGQFLKQIRSVTRNFVVPEDACASFKTLYQGLEAFEADLHQHIHLENNLLFPRAIALEEAVQSA